MTSASRPGNTAGDAEVMGRGVAGIQLPAPGIASLTARLIGTCPQELHMRRLFARSLHIKALLLCATVAGTLAATVPAPAHAEGWDRGGDWRRHEWREHEWREHRWREWREHEWWEHHRPYSFYGAPGY